MKKIFGEILHQASGLKGGNKYSIIDVLIVPAISGTARAAAAAVDVSTIFGRLASSHV